MMRSILSFETITAHIRLSDLKIPTLVRLHAAGQWPTSRRERDKHLLHAPVVCERSQERQDRTSGRSPFPPDVQVHLRMRPLLRLGEPVRIWDFQHSSDRGRAEAD